MQGNLFLFCWTSFIIIQRIKWAGFGFDIPPFFFFCGLGCVSHTIDYVAYLFGSEISELPVASRHDTNLAMHPTPYILATHLPFPFMTFSSQEKIYCASSFGLVLSQSLVYSRIGFLFVFAQRLRLQYVCAWSHTHTCTCSRHPVRNRLTVWQIFKK